MKCLYIVTRPTLPPHFIDCPDPQRRCSSCTAGPWSAGTNDHRPARPRQSRFFEEQT